MKLYKLTDQEGRTKNNTQWGDGVTHTAPGTGDLCSSGWLHAYTDPLLAILLNPGHANISEPRLWEVEGEVGATDHGLKVGCTSMTTVREIPVPVITIEQRILFSILCALEVCQDEKFKTWADRWMSGEDRSKEASAWTVAATAASASEASAWTVAAEAARAADIDFAFLAKKSVGAA